MVDITISSLAVCVCVQWEICEQSALQIFSYETRTITTRACVTFCSIICGWFSLLLNCVSKLWFFLYCKIKVLVYVSIICCHTFHMTHLIGSVGIQGQPFFLPTLVAYHILHMQSFVILCFIHIVPGWETIRSCFKNMLSWLNSRHHQPSCKRYVISYKMSLIKSND